MNTNIKKKNQRNFFSKKREELKNKDVNSSIALCKKILEIKEFNKANVIASFVSIKTEISTEPLNEYMQSLGKNICLPVISDKNKHLIFRLYNKGDNLILGKYGVPEPDSIKEEILPSIILTPCLAFDKFGYRLGYGGGYYDRTFLKLKKSAHSFVSIALAYDDQQADRVIRNNNDQKINYILTEKEIYRIG